MGVLSYAQLTDRLHAIEAVIPPDIVADTNFAGLRLDASGTFLRVAQVIADRRPLLVDRLCRDRAFREFADAHGLQAGVEHGPTRLLGSCAAGDQGYTPERNYAHFGTFGWIVCFDGRAASFGSYHVFCRSGDASRRGGDAIFWRDRSGQSLPRRVGTLHDFVPMAHADPRLFDLAVVAFDAAVSIASLHNDWHARSGRAYPVRLEHIEASDEEERYYVVGAGMIEDCVELRFRGVGTRRDTVTGYYFRDQLFFEPADARFHPVGGDSGAVVVHERSNTVVGLLMMTSSGFTVANPLHRMPWKPLADTVVLDHVELPAFASA
jgi:hypothetical protein